MTNLVQIAAKLYECRDTAKFLLGEKYGERMAIYGEWIHKRATHRNVDALVATQEIIKEVGNDDGHFAIQMLAAAVELIEPSEVPEKCPFGEPDEVFPEPSHPTIGVCAHCSGEAKIRDNGLLWCYPCAYSHASRGEEKL